jgi:PAS domain S-box-containing protein
MMKKNEVLAIEKQAKINEERSKKAEEIGNVGHWEYDIANNQIWGSDQAKKIFGFAMKGNTLTLEDIEARIPERERVHQVLVNLIEKGMPYDLEYEIIQENTSDRRTVISKAEVERNSEGLPIKIIGVIQDITERKRMEAALQEREQRYRALFENAPIMFGVLDDEGNYEEVNDSVLSILGYTNEELISQNAFDLIHPEDIPEVQTAFLQMQQTGTGEAVYRYKHKDGKYRHIRSKATKIPNINHNYIYSEDITSRIVAEEKLNQNLETLSLGEEIATLGYFERNWQTGIGYWSNGFYRLLGVSTAELDCTHAEFTKFLHPDDLQRVAKHIQDTLKEHRDMDVEFRLVQPNGTILHIHGIGRNFYDDEGKALKTIGTFQNITERKLTEKELEQHRIHLEELVKERTEELTEKNAKLERFNKLFVGREFRIKELKERVKELEDEIRVLKKGTS